MEGKKKRSNTVAALFAVGTGLGGFALFIYLSSLILTPASREFKSINKKALQAEAKTTLASLYVGQKSFYSEWDQYTTDIQSIGFQPYGIAHYKFGFAAPSTIVKERLAKQVDSMKYDPNRMSSDVLKTEYGQRAPASSFTDLVRKHCPDCTASENGFKIVAISNLDDDEALDIWTIDQDKNLIHVSNDVAN